jgi:hypothetical protein
MVVLQVLHLLICGCLNLDRLNAHLLGNVRVINGLQFVSPFFSLNPSWTKHKKCKNWIFFYLGFLSLLVILVRWVLKVATLNGVRWYVVWCFLLGQPSQVIVSHWEKWMTKLNETQCKWCVRLYRVVYSASLMLHFEVCIYVLLEIIVVCKSWFMSKGSVINNEFTNSSMLGACNKSCWKSIFCVLPMNIHICHLKTMSHPFGYLRYWTCTNFVHINHR